MNVTRQTPWLGIAALLAFATVEAPADERPHWAFQPVAKPAVPRPAAHHGPTALDAILGVHQDKAGVEASEIADRYTRIRRLALDLTGLPPRYEDVQAFLQAESPNAYERLVDRLIASPHYGERWGRHWLDVARYADNKGYVFEEERRYPYSYTYRDWVVDSLNADLPYDQFLIRQLAGDHVAKETGQDRAQAALGFLTLGRRFLNREPDIIDDRIDVMTRGMLGLTVSCARCHDHKFDPIPTADYYSLYGVFASSEEPGEKPLLGTTDERDPVYARFKEREQELEDAIEAYFNQRHEGLRSSETLAEYLKLCFEGREFDDTAFDSESQKRKLYQEIARSWRDYLREKVKEGHEVFALWGALSAAPADAFGDACASILDGPMKEKAHPVVLEAFRQGPPTSMEAVIDLYARLLSSSPLKETVLEADGSPVAIEPRQLYRLFNTPEQQEVRRMRREVEKFRAEDEGAPARAMALVDKEQPVEPKVFVRGDPRRPGETVPRQFLEVLSGEQRKPFEIGSGRFEMARSIASPDNPLAARVFVNRVWMHHFGEPLVDSPSDFGVRTEEPPLRKALDLLAWQFVRDDGWSVKKLHRRILLSHAYQRSSRVTDSAKERDPGNRLWSHGKRRRLEFEAMRDGVLAVSGELDRRLGGRPVNIAEEPASARRTLYGFIDRQNLPALFRTFDFATPDAHTPQRLNTTVPQQALFFMNSPFVEQRAAVLAGQARAQGEAGEGVTWLYRQLLSRDPDAEELQTGVAFLSQWTEGVENADFENWQAYAQALLGTNAFMFVD